MLEFLYTFLPRLKWHLAPRGFLYDLYKAWYRDVNPSGRPCRQGEFWDLAKAACGRHGDELGWHPTDGRERTKHLMAEPEPLAVEYKLEKWTKAKYKGSYEAIGLPENLSERYEGLKRDVVSPKSCTDGDAPASDGTSEGDFEAEYAQFVVSFHELEAAEARGDVGADGEPVKVPCGPHGWRRAYRTASGVLVRDYDDFADGCVTCDEDDLGKPITFDVWLRHKQTCPYLPHKHPDEDFDCDVCGIHYKASRWVEHE